MRVLRPGVRRVVVVLALTAGAMLTGGGLGLADPTPRPPQPPSPSNPTDQQLDRSKQDVTGAAGQVGRLTGELAAAQARADALGAKLEVRRETANKALVDLQTARDAAASAARRAQATHAETAAASATVEQAQQRLDTFIAAAYERGAQSGSLGLLAEAGDPDDVVGRAELTEDVAQDQRAAMDAIRRAQIAKVNSDSLARAAEQQALAARNAATSASKTADNAVASARAAVSAGLAQLRQVDSQRAGIEHQLDVLTAKDAGLHAQRQRYLDYQAQVAAQALAARVGAARGARGSAGSATSGGGAQAVISRAMSQLGVSYAWGGGTGSGPSKGIRDGGVADEFGDFDKTGFDCSGLMIYAFQVAGIGLPHFSGYQYNAGKKVPISQIQPGDMLFWSDGGTIHHVALYIGNGKMVEAPYSGGAVRISPVRYGDGLMPNAARMF